MPRSVVGWCRACLTLSKPATATLHASTWLSSSKVRTIGASGQPEVQPGNARWVQVKLLLANFWRLAGHHERGESSQRCASAVARTLRGACRIHYTSCVKLAYNLRFTIWPYSRCPEKVHPRDVFSRLVIVGPEQIRPQHGWNRHKDPHQIKLQ